MGLCFGLYMAWSIGANDVANAMGTSVGSKALTLKQAILVAAILEFAGAFLVGPHVTETIRKNIIPIEAIQTIPDGTQLYVFGMLAALLAAAVFRLTRQPPRCTGAISLLRYRPFAKEPGHGSQHGETDESLDEHVPGPVSEKVEDRLSRRFGVHVTGSSYRRAS